MFYPSGCIAGIVRVVFLRKNEQSDDPSWSIAPVFVWSCVEPFIGIVCACLPTFSPLFRRWWTAIKVKKSDTNKREGYNGTRNTRTHRSRPISSDDEDEDDDGLQGDEVKLTNFPGWPLNFLRGKDRRANMGSTAIRIKEEVTISWT